VKPQALEVCAKVFSALRHLGFREAQVRAALEQLQAASQRWCRLPSTACYAKHWPGSAPRARGG
jgi:Holliday junction resolvasome RuvABC DNA-binding subunit